jgi:hypothetical protein
MLGGAGCDGTGADGDGFAMVGWCGVVDGGSGRIGVERPGPATTSTTRSSCAGGQVHMPRYSRRDPFTSR